MGTGTDAAKKKYRLSLLPGLELIIHRENDLGDKRLQTRSKPTISPSSAPIFATIREPIDRSDVSPNCWTHGTFTFPLVCQENPSFFVLHLDYQALPLRPDLLRFLSPPEKGLTLGLSRIDFDQTSRQNRYI